MEGKSSYSQWRRPVLHIANIVNKKLLSEFSLELHLCDDNWPKTATAAATGQNCCHNIKMDAAHLPRASKGSRAMGKGWVSWKVVACNHNT